jgi:hypothetical protein
MANPASRQQLKEYCLRRLGEPVVDVNVDDEQLEDRIDDALKFYQDYHYDGTERIFLKHQITAADKTNEYIEINDNIIGVVRVFDIGDSLNSSNLFNIRYQIHLNDLFDFTSTTYVPYVTAMRHVEQLEEIFVGKKPIRFNRHKNQLHIDMDWGSDVQVGEYIIVEAYRILDPDTYTDVYGDRWLREYTTQLFKRQWGENLKKFEGMQLPGGLQFNGQQIYNEAQDEIARMESEVTTNYGGIVMDMTG